jgi:hypothetical protein
MAKVGDVPIGCGFFDIKLPEVMYYLYLPVIMCDSRANAGDPFIRLPQNVEVCRPLIARALERAMRPYRYVYLSARKGWATPDNPLNRPGWHCDGFGTGDLNFVWWSGPGTRFACGNFGNISNDHIESLRQFEGAIYLDERAPCPKLNVFSPPAGNLYKITPRVVHATPLIGAPGCMREYVKISLSDDRYNLENNSHNHLFDYDWPLHSRDVARNDPSRAQADSVAA